MSEISETKMHHLICAFCDNLKCVRGTKQCEFEQWKRQQAESEVQDADSEVQDADSN